MRSNLRDIPEAALPTEPGQLPGELRNVAEIIAEVLRAARPELAGDAQRLATRAVFVLADQYRGSAIYCHTQGDWWRNYRDGLIRAEFDRRTTSGESARQVVASLAGREWPGDQRRIGERQVWNILGESGVDERQMGMF